MTLGKLEELLPTVANPVLHAIVKAVRAESLADQGDIDAALLAYDDSIRALSGQAEDPFVSSLYFAKQLVAARQVMRVGGMHIDADLVVADQAKRLDLWFEGQHPLNRAYLIQQSGQASVGQRNFTEALRHYQLAIDMYEEYGARAEAAEVYGKVAQLHEQAGNRDQALVLYARLGQVEDTQRLAASLAIDSIESERIVPLINALRMFGSVLAIVGRTAAFGALADVVPDQSLDGVMKDLLIALDGEDATSNDHSPRRLAARALFALAPRIAQKKIGPVAEALLSTLDRASWWTTPVQVAGALGRLIESHPTLPASLQERIVARIIQVDNGQNPLVSGDIAKVVFRVARRSQKVGVRKAASDYFSATNEPLIVGYQCCLGLKVEKEKTAGAIEQLLDGFDAHLDVNGSAWSLRQGQYHPQTLSLFRDSMTNVQIDVCISQLIGTVLNEHNSLGTRAAALTTLGDLAIKASPAQVVKLVALIDRVTREGLTVSGYATAHGTGPNEGAEVHSAVCWLATVLFSHLDTEDLGETRERIYQILLSGSESADVTARFGTARAIDRLRNIRENEHGALVIRLAGLLHDADNRVVAQTVLSIVAVLRHNGLPTQYLHESILSLADRSKHVDVRRVIAHALACLTFDEPYVQDAQSLRSRLANDSSYRVRQALNGDAGLEA